jgi:hypothetical protein
MFLVHKGIEKGGSIRSLGKLFVQLLKHFVEKNLNIELSLHSINQVDLVIISFRIKPTMRSMTFQNTWQSELPYFYMISQKVKEST